MFHIPWYIPQKKRRKDEYAGTKVPVINTLLDDESERTTSIVMIRGSRCRLLERGICLRKQAYISYQAPIELFSVLVIFCVYLLLTLICRYSACILCFLSLRLRFFRVDTVPNSRDSFRCRSAASSHYDVWSRLRLKPLVDVTDGRHNSLCEVFWRCSTSSF